MRMLCFSERTAKEILRDPLNLGFGIGFPVILLLLLSAIQANIPVSLFEIQKLSPGIAVFGFAFITLFAASLVAKDRESAFLSRLYTTPLTAADFILGYLLPLVPIAIAQSVICYVVAAVLGLKLSVNILLAVLAVIPISLFFISAGLMFGSILSVKQVGAVCGAFRKIAYALPFVHAVELERAVVAGSFGDVMPHLLWVAGYAVLLTVLAVLLFTRQMKK